MTHTGLDGGGSDMPLRPFGTLPPDPRFGAFQQGGTGLTRTARDTILADGTVVPGGDQLNRADRGVFDAPAVVDPVAAPVAFTGSPLNTLYGIDSESYLTDDQRKLARMIQGKFDASVNRRDRELARYNAPRLSSFAEDEALARAMSLARGLNYKEPVVPDPYGQGANIMRPGGTTAGGGGVPRVPAAAVKPTDEGAAANAKWQRILAGLASLAPLLFGKDAYGQFLNKGLLGTVKEAIFGKGAANAISDEQLEQIVQSGGLPGAGGVVYNPITGMPMATYTDSGTGLPYGPGSGFGQDVVPTPDGYDNPLGGDVTAPSFDAPGGFWDSGYYYPDLGGGAFDSFDPFGIGGY